MKLHANVCSQWEWTKLRQLLVIVLLGLGIVSTYGQTKTVSGIVKSESGGEPLVGATVKVKETNTGGITDIDGRYTIQANLGQTLIVSYIGYRTKEVKVERTTRIDILLQEDNEMLDEVVVVGYGTMKRSDLTGSVVSVTGDELKKSVVTSLDQALQGRAAGVQVTQNSGTPGGGISVSIRGINSLNGNEPLYVIDGVAISGNNTSNSSVLSSINPADIVSMEVLKDASATAIYGSRASNGVVLITTRQGEEGKTKVSYEGYYALQQLPKKLETLTLPEYAVYQNLRAATIGFGAREEFKDPSLLSRGTDWQNEIFRTAPMHNHQINISGGSKSMKYSLSGGYMQQDGIVFGSDFERFSFRVNMDNDLRASVARTQQTNNVDGSGAIYNALNQLPEVPARNPDGSFGMQTENMYGTYFSNPLSDLIQNENYSRNTQVYVNAFADIKLWKGLVFRTEYAANFNYSNDYKFTPSYDYEHFKQQSSASRGAGNGSNWTLKTYFTYNNTFGKHGLSAMLGHEAQENKYESLSGSRTNFLFNSVHELDAGDATTAKANSSRGSSAIESYFGRLNYNYDDRYLLTATLRADGSSSFAKESRWGWFPSVALAWKVNNEAFLKDVEAINSLKLRLGWGVVGNQWAGSYAYGVTMASAASIWGTGFYAGNYPNRELKWEETNSFNVGLDLALFNNRIEFIADAYYKKTDNLLMQASLPTYVSGLIRAPWVNAGAMTNKGVEFTLNTHNIQTRDFTWTSGLTFSINHNEVTKLYSESSAISGINGSETLTYTMVGEPVGQFYGYKVIGMFKEEGDFYKKGADGNFLLDETGNRIQVAIPKDQTIGKSGIWVGDYIYEDRDNNGVIDEKDRTFLGNPAPKFTFGFNNYLSYKGFDLNIFLNGSVGNKAINLIRRTFTDPMRNSNLLKEATGIAQIAMHDPEVGDEVLSNVYVANADAAKVQRITTSSANDNNRISDRFVEDASYLRIKNISLGYTFPQKWLRRLQIDHLRLYVNIQNLCTITGYKGYDPEIGALNYNVLLRGVDDARYPSQRIYTFGLNFNF
mgnify:FL=1